MDSEIFRQARKPVTQEDIQQQVNVPASAPPQLQQMLAKANRQVEDVPTGPRLAYTGNKKLDELLAGLAHRYEEATFPSRSKFYKDGPTNGIINVRCMTGEEEQILATPRYIKKGQAMNMIFKNCVRENIHPDQLLTVDRTWLLIYLRGISYSPTYEVEVRCTECNSKFQTVIDLDSLPVTLCPEDFGPEKLQGVLPKTGYSFTYRLSTGKDENMIQAHRDQRIKQNNDGDHDDTWTYRASLLINDIEGLTDKGALHALLSRLPIQDVGHIRNVMMEPPFGVDTRVPVICPNCSEEFTVEMPMDANFFFPRPKKAKM